MDLLLVFIIIIILIFLLDTEIGIIIMAPMLLSLAVATMYSMVDIEIRGATKPEPTRAAEPIYDPYDIYGPKYEQWRAYQQSYDDYPEPRPVAHSSHGEVDRSVDMAGVMMAQRRARDKKCLDGRASKDVNFYKYHFGQELNEAEAKPWWSAYDY